MERFVAPMGTFVSPLESVLDPGEKLLWSGQPRQGVYLQAGDIFLIPFSLMWGGFAIFWEAGVLGLVPLGQQGAKFHQPPLFMALWGIPFVLVGLYMIFGRFFFDAFQRSKTYYGVTNQRLIVMKPLSGSNLTSYDYATLTNLNLVERGNGSGDILFGTPSPFAGLGSSFPAGRGRYAPPGFYSLAEARAVYNRIRDARQQAKV